MRRPRLILAAVLAGLAAWAAMLLAPSSAYVRWQNLRTEAYARLGWIYERVHFDPTPVDVAFVGTSHTMNGIDAQRVAELMAAEGLRTADGRCVTTTNLAVPEYGRNMHWLIARELLRSRPVKVLVLEVLENETRKAHPAFAQVAEAPDILGAPALLNLNYVHDMVRLPFRQATLAVESLSPRQFGLKDRFDLKTYDGSTVDNTRYVNVDGKRITPLRDHVMPEAELRRAAQQLAETKQLHMLPSTMDALEYKVPRHYVTALLDLARAKGVKVVFLYLPGFGKPPAPVDDRLYRGRGPMIEVNDILKRPAIWFDVHHLNAQGAEEASGAVAGKLAAVLTGDTAAWSRVSPTPASPCANGLPPRPAI